MDKNGVIACLPNIVNSNTVNFSHGVLCNLCISEVEHLGQKMSRTVNYHVSNSSCNTETIAINSNLTSTNRTSGCKNELEELCQNHSSHCETQVKCNLDLASDSQNARNKSTHGQTTSSKSLKCVALNVSGLNSKLPNGVLDQYLSQFDIVSLVETNTDSPVLSETLLNNYSCFSMKKNQSYPEVQVWGYSWIMYMCKLNLSGKSWNNSWHCVRMYPGAEN